MNLSLQNISTTVPNHSSRLHPYFVTGFTDKNQKGIRQFNTKKSSTNNNLSNSVVVWGINLTSQVGRGRITKQESNMIKLAPYQKSIIIGLLLSDGWLTIASKTTKNARLGFKQSLDRSTYVWFVFNLLSHYCNSSPQLTKGVRSGKPFYALNFFTRSLPCFTELHTLFYPSGTKIIPSNIYELLTPVALAHVIQGDGLAVRHGLFICTDSYKLVDIVRLMNVLIIKYRLECIIHYHTSTQPRIYIRQRSMPLLRDIVRPHMEKSMLYKIEAKLKVKPVKEPKIEVTNLESGEIIKFVTIKEAAKALNVSHPTIAYYLKNKNKKRKPLLGKYSLNYIGKEEVVV